MKKQNKLEKKLGCPYIKKCAFKGILYPCREDGYTDCSIYLSNVEEKEQERNKSKQLRRNKK